MFVDDDELVLDGLRDALRPLRRRWSMRFVASGDDALASIDDQPCDVVVCDLRMPVMDGATLLEQVRVLSPDTVRIVLSGDGELRLVARAAGVAHRLLSKPCETEHLVDVVERACAIKQTIARVERNRSGVGASVLPSVPHLYLQLSEALSSGDATVDDVTRIVEQDMAMAAKILQLANSAYFGRRQPVTAIRGAVVYLGLDALHALVLQAGTFRKFPIDHPIPRFDIESLQRHCSRVGSLARQLLPDAEVGRDAYTAGLLHDVGLLVLASQEPGELARVLEIAEREQRPVHEVERELRDVTHAEMGAHLLALWGLPFTVTAAVSAHHDPPRAGAPLDEVTATYLANVLIEQAEASAGQRKRVSSELDTDLVVSHGLEDHLPRWRELARALVDRNTPA